MSRLAFVGCIFALVVTVMELVADYRADMAQLSLRLDQIEESYLNSVAEMVWLQDQERLDLLIAGIHRLPDIAHVEVRDEQGGVILQVGDAEAATGPGRILALTHTYRGTAMAIGDLRIATSLDQIRARLWVRLRRIAAANAALILVAMVLVHASVSTVVTRPLGRMAAHARLLGETGLTAPPPDVPMSDGEDEFTDLAHAFADMHRALGGSYAAVQDSESRYRDLFTNSPVSLWEEDFSAVRRAVDEMRPQIADLAEYLAAHPERVRDLAALVRVLDVNQASVLLHRADSRDDLLGGLPRTFTNSSFAAFRRQLLAIWHHEFRLTLESEIKTLDGEPRMVVVRWYVPPPVRDTLERVIVSLEDITDRKLAERSLNITVEKLVETNAELERFTQVAAHDLQEPVRTIVSFSQLLERQLADHADPVIAEYLAYIRSAAMRMQGQVRGLADYAGAGQPTSGFTSVDTTATVRAVLEMLRVAITESDGRVEVGALPVISGDPGLLQQAFLHLLSNAIKFHAPGRPPHVSVTAQRESDYWHYRVRDNGIGIDLSYINTIFRVFGRLHGPTDYPGVGIGLAITRRIIEMHGGHIWLDSLPGTGTTVHFTLPPDDDRPPASAINAAREVSAPLARREPL